MPKKEEENNRGWGKQRGRDKGEFGNPEQHCTHHPAAAPAEPPMRFQLRTRTTFWTAGPAGRCNPSVCLQGEGGLGTVKRQRVLTAPGVGRAALSWELGDSDPDLSRPPSRENYLGQQRSQFALHVSVALKSEPH